MRKIFLLMIIPFLFSIAFAAAPQYDLPTSEQCDDITSIGFASKDNPGILDPNKILALVESGELGYKCAKNILGLWDYDFYIMVTDISGSSFETINTGSRSFIGIYGLFPGKPLTQLVSGVHSSLQTVLNPLQPYGAPGGGIGTAMAVAGMEREYSPISDETLISTYMSPEFQNFQNLKTFKRVVLIEDETEGYKVVLITLGVWNWPGA